MTGDRLEELRRSAHSLTLLCLVRRQAEALGDLDADLFRAVHGVPLRAFLEHIEALEVEARRAQAWLSAFVHDDAEAGEGLQ